MISLAFLLSQSLFAKAYGGSENDIATDIVQTADGGYVVAGYTLSFGAGAEDVLVLKLSPDGSLEWAKAIGSSRDEEAYSVIQTVDGGYALAGWTWDSGAGVFDLLVLKLSSNGSLEWAKAFGGENGEVAYSIVQTSDGGYAVAGWTVSFDADNYRIFILKLSSDGSLEWAKAIGEANKACVAHSIVQTPDGGYAVGGYAKALNADDWDFLVLKLSSDGSLEWAKAFGGDTSDAGYSLSQTPDGGYMVTGLTRSFGAGGYDVLALKLSPDGSLEWARTFGGSDNDYANFVVQTSDGGCVFAGATGSPGAYRLLVFKISSYGSVEWGTTLGTNAFEEAHSVIQTSDNGYVAAGYGYSSKLNSDFLVLKVASDGSYPECVEEYSLSVDTPNIQILSPALTISDVSPTVSTPSFTASDAPLEVYDLCEPYPGVYQGPAGRSRVLALPAPGGLLFKSQKSVNIKIYSASGRLVRELKLSQGKAFVPLKAGVYIWEAGEVRGKAAVR